jgi:hypothetical protein
MAIVQMCTQCYIIQHSAFNVRSCVIVSIMSKVCCFARCVQAAACESIMLSFVVHILGIISFFIPAPIY